MGVLKGLRNMRADGPRGPLAIRHEVWSPYLQVGEPTVPEEAAPVRLAQFRAWPAPQNHQLNKADKRGEGDGQFGSPRKNHPHRGIDIQGGYGDDIAASDDGVVVRAGNTDPKGYGRNVLIEHANGTQTLYGHLGAIKVKRGDRVKAGQSIGTMGRSGNTPKQGDTHLHFEVREGAGYIDPTGRFGSGR